jgi:hypothetical protein
VKRPLTIYAAVVLLVGLGVSRLYTTLGIEGSFRLSQIILPVLMLSAALWLWVHPKSARWIVAAYFAAGAVKQAIVLPAFAGSGLDILRRPFSLGIAAWLAFTLLLGRDVRRYLTQLHAPNQAKACLRFNS